jgi:cytoskeleton protein RodZ
MAEIGATLREARMRARIDVSEIEAQTKIRAKYLRALENEEWDLLPGPTFVKSFLRTYATALGLDGKSLVEEYRLSYELPTEPEPIVASSRKTRVPSGPRAPGPSRGYAALVAIVVIVIVLLIYGLLSGGGGGPGTASTGTGTHHRSAHRGQTPNTSTTHSTLSVITLQMRATGSVYVCLLDESGRRLIAGKTLQTGESTPVYRSRRFELTLGNNAVALTIDGIPRVVPPSASAIGYSITKAGRRTLAPGQQPTCT